MPHKNLYFAENQVEATLRLTIARLAATGIHQGEHLLSFDADFRPLLPRSQFARLAAA